MIFNVRMSLTDDFHSYRCLNHRLPRLHQQSFPQAFRLRCGRVLVRWRDDHLSLLEYGSYLWTCTCETRIFPCPTSVSTPADSYSQLEATLRLDTVHVPGCDSRCKQDYGCVLLRKARKLFAFCAAMNPEGKTRCASALPLRGFEISVRNFGVTLR